MTDPEPTDRPSVIIDSISPDLLNTRAKEATEVNWIRLSDDFLERSSVTVSDDQTVTIPAATYRALMSDAGWKQR